MPRTPQSCKGKQTKEQKQNKTKKKIQQTRETFRGVGGIKESLGRNPLFQGGNTFLRIKKCVFALNGIIFYHKECFKLTLQSHVLNFI